jgi:propionate CoA-transferase
VLTADQVAATVQDGDTLATCGFVGAAMPEALLKALEDRFEATETPTGLTYLFSAAQGGGAASAAGADHVAHVGLTKRVIGAHYNLSPRLGTLLMANQIQGYCLPQGVLSHLFRDIAAGRPGTITHVGLGTYVDPRLEGGKLNDITTEDLVHVVDILGQEKLLYRSLPIDVAFLRGTYADQSGNVTLEKEAVVTEVTAIAQATKNSGGKVFVQVQNVVAAGTLDPRLVQIPGIYVDGVVVADPRDHEQLLYTAGYDPALCGEVRDALSVAEHPVPLDPKKIIGRRACMELTPGSVVNLGIGIPEYVAMVAKEEGMDDYMTLTVEAGPVGGVPLSGGNFGASRNPEAILSMDRQFDFYSGGGIDLAFLGLAQADGLGNINVSKFSGRLAGCGGFIDITQNAKRVFFCGTFTAGGLRVRTGDGRLTVEQEGREHKFVEAVEQVTFSGEFARKTGRPVTYITERAVFELRPEGLCLTEVAPGVNIRTQVLNLMAFEPNIDGPKIMDARLFQDDLMGLRATDTQTTRASAADTTTT